MHWLTRWNCLDRGSSGRSCVRNRTAANLATPLVALAVLVHGRHQGRER